MTNLEIIELYFETIIKPLEKEIKSLHLKINKKRFYFTKNIEKQYLQKMEKMLIEYYNHLELFFKY